MDRQGSELIAADLAIESSSAIPAELQDEAAGRGLETARVVEFRSVVMGERGPQLVQITAADAAYPLRCQVRIRDRLDTPDRVVRHSLDLLDVGDAQVAGIVSMGVDPRVHVRSGFADAEVYHPRYGGYLRE